MLPRSRTAVSLAALALVASFSAEAAEPFADAGLAAAAKTFEAAIVKQLSASVKKPAAELRADAEKVSTAPNADARAAVTAHTLALVADPKEPAPWLGLARALLAIDPKTYQGTEATTVPDQARQAAYRAYDLAKAPALKAQALATLATGHVRKQAWRPALTAYTASLALREDAAVRAAYVALRNQHGFRVVDTKIETDSAAPRACIVFSERLAGGSVEWARFVRVDGREPGAVTADGKQLCVDGLAFGKSYKIGLREGLPSSIAGEDLTKASELATYVADRTASVRAAGKAYVLPSSGQQGVPLTTVNVDLLGVEVYRVGDRNLVQALQNEGLTRSIASYDLETIRETTGQKVYAGELVVAARLNEEVTTAFPVSEALPRLQPGLYLLAATALPKRDGGEDSRRRFAGQWFIVSELGLTTYTGKDGLHAFVRSLGTAGPLAGVTVSLIARNNEVLGTATTDARGHARFDTKLHKGEGGAKPSVVTAATAEGDYAFLDVATTPFDLTDRGVKGRAAPGPIDAFAYTDRGVYRPGETVHLTALVRDTAAVASPVPVTMIVTRPDGVEHRRLVLPDQGLGGRLASLALGGNAMGGTWRAKVFTDPKADPIAAVSFLVEDFIPEKMDVKLIAETPALTLEAGGAIKLAGTYLYGPPAAGLAVEGDVVVRPAKAGLAAFPGYHFGLADEKITTAKSELEGLPETGADGTARVPVKLPQIEKTARPLEADVHLRLRETSGRTVERTVTLPVDLGQVRLGVKPSFPDLQAQEGATESFDVVLVDGAGKAIAGKDVTWELLRLEQRWQWFSRDGETNYEMQTLSRRVGAGALTLDGTTPGRITHALEWGRYRLEVTSGTGPAAIKTSIVFHAGYYADEAADSPEMLDVALDKPSYRSGETARLKVASRFAGKALVTVLGLDVHAVQEADIPAGGGEIALPVAAGWGAGAYVAVTLFRPLDGPAKRMPGRAIGMRWLPIDQAERTLGVALEAPAQVKPGTTTTVPVRLSGLAAGEEARVTLAAVDVGILNLTRFEAPRPEQWFYGQRKLGLDLRDYYGRLIDGMRADKGRLRSGGDGADGESLAAKGSPPVEKTLALFSGLVTVGPDGVAHVPLTLPDFNGAVRLSAVAWTREKVGSAAKDMIVRDAIALTVAAPRFLTLGDTARLQVDVHNVEGPAADYKLAVTLNPLGGGAGVPLGERTLALKAGEKRADAVTLKPADVGAWPMTVSVSGPNGLLIKRDLMFDVKPPGGDIRRVTVAEIAPRGGTLSVTKDLLQDLIPASAKTTINVGPLASLDVPGLLNQLDRYPYGCAEQTTSRALPLLYANDVARAVGLAEDKDIQERLRLAVERLFEMQDSSGAFGIWGPADGDLWLTSYVTDFLLRAKENRVAVDERGLHRALDRLQNYLAYAQEVEAGGAARAYAVYVLARGGRTPAGDVRYYVDGRLDTFTTPLALAHLGAAASLLGDQPRAQRAFDAALAALERAAGPSGALRDDYGSALRDRAAVVTLASEVKAAPARLPQLADVLAKAAAASRYTSTQEQAWLLLAARALADQGAATALTVNGAAHTGRLVRGIKGVDLAAAPTTIINTGEAPVPAVVSVMGAALTAEPAVAQGFKITREYYALDGKKLDFKSAAGGTSSIKQNDRMVVVLKVEATQKGGRILLVDRLPAGLEVENPRLVDSADVKTLDWLTTTRKPAHTEFKDDRFVAAFDFFAGRASRGGEDAGDVAEATDTATVAYLVRAVTPGSFVHPAATVEDMYRPDRHARTATGRLDVTAK
jgi:uncharacterized protein YfaS (alpha-2-macroglobulin family)